MAPWIIPLAMTVLQAQQNKEKEGKSREEALADLHAGRASSLGFPTYGVQAAQTNRKLDDEFGAENHLAGLIPLLMNRGQ